MKVSCDYKLDNYRVLAMVENPTAMLESVHRQVKAAIAYEVAKHVDVIQTDDDPVSLEQLKEMAKPNEFNAFATIPVWARPAYSGSIHVFTIAQYGEIQQALFDLNYHLTMQNEFEAKEKIAELQGLLTQ